MIDTEMLRLLCCPETHQPLAFAEPALIERLNELVRAGQLRNRSGQLVSEAFQAGFIREDRQFLYPIRDEIPILLIEEAIPLAGLKTSGSSS